MEFTDVQNTKTGIKNSFFAHKSLGVDSVLLLMVTTHGDNLHRQNQFLLKERKGRISSRAYNSFYQSNPGESASLRAQLKNLAAEKRTESQNMEQPSGSVLDRSDCTQSKSVPKISV